MYAVGTPRAVQIAWPVHVRSTSDSPRMILVRIDMQIYCREVAPRPETPLQMMNPPSAAAKVASSSSLPFIHRHSAQRRREIFIRSSSDARKVASTDHPPTITTTSNGIGSISDVFWPSAGAFLAMALLGRLDRMMDPRWAGGVSFTTAPLGAICALLLTAPNSPAAQKRTMFVAQITCAAIGVLAFSLFGPGWLARSSAVAASIAFMIVTRASHPPAASLPILFIDGAKFHQLQFWYMLFPGLTGCILICLIQEVVFYLKANCRF